MIRHEEFDTLSVKENRNLNKSNDDKWESRSEGDSDLFDSTSTTSNISSKFKMNTGEMEGDISNWEVDEDELEAHLANEADISEHTVTEEALDEVLERKESGIKGVFLVEAANRQARDKELEQEQKEQREKEQKERAKIIAASGATEEDIAHQEDILRESKYRTGKEDQFSAEQKEIREKREREKAIHDAKTAPLKKVHGESKLNNLSFEDFIWWGIASLDTNGDKKKEFGPVVNNLKAIKGILDKVKSDGIEDTTSIEVIYSSMTEAVAAAKHYLTTHASLITWSQYGRDRKAFCRIITNPAFMDKRCAEIGMTKKPEKNNSKDNHAYSFGSKSENSSSFAQRLASVRGILLPGKYSEDEKNSKPNSFEAYIVFSGLDGISPKEMLADKKFKEYLAIELKKENFQTGLDYTRNRVNYENGSITLQQYAGNVAKINKAIEVHDTAFVDDMVNALMWEENVDEKDISKIVHENKSKTLKNKEKAAYRTALLELVREIRFSGSLNDKNTGSGLENIGFKEDINAGKSQAKKPKAVKPELSKKEQLYKDYNASYDRSEEMKKNYNGAKNLYADYRKHLTELPKDIVDLEDEYQFSKIDFEKEKLVSYSDATSGLEKELEKLKKFNEKNGVSRADRIKELDELIRVNDGYKDKYERDKAEKVNEMASAGYRPAQAANNNLNDEIDKGLDEENNVKAHFYDGDLGKNQTDFDENEKAWRIQDNYKELIEKNEKKIKELKASLTEEEKIQAEVYKYKCWILFNVKAGYREAEKKVNDTKEEWDISEIEKNKQRELYRKEDLREEGEFRKQCGGLSNEEEAALCKSIIEQIKSGNTDKKSKLALNKDFGKILFSYFLRYQDSDDEKGAVSAVTQMLSDNIGKELDAEKWSTIQASLSKQITKTWKTIYNSFDSLLNRTVDNTNTGFDYGENAKRENVVKGKDGFFSAEHDDKNSKIEFKSKINNDAVRIQANRGEYAQVLKIFEGLQADIKELGVGEDGEKKSFQDAYADIIEYMSDSNLSDTVSLEEYISKGNSDFTEYMSDEGTTLDLSTLTLSTAADFDNRKNNLIRDVSPIERFIRLVMIEKINGEYIDSQLMVGGKNRELMRIAATVHRANMAYIASIDSFFKQRNGFSLVDMTFVENWRYGGSNEEYRDEAMANRKKYQEINASVDSQIMDYKRKPQLSAKAGDMSRIEYEKSQTKSFDDTNKLLNDAELRTLEKTYKKFGLKEASGYTEEVLAKMGYEELETIEHFLRENVGIESKEYKQVMQEIEKRDNEQQEQDWLRTQAFYADDL